MSLTRRRLFQQLADRGREASHLDQATYASSVLRISLNENPVGAGQQVRPYEKSHTRISIGTMEEMRRAVQTFERALVKPAAAA